MSFVIGSDFGVSDVAKTDRAFGAMVGDKAAGSRAMDVGDFVKEFVAMSHGRESEV